MLKPCPFCGGAFRVVESAGPNNLTVYHESEDESCPMEAHETWCGPEYLDRYDRRPIEDALRARAEAAEARAAQAGADARLMLAELYYADERCIFDDRLPLDERTAVSGMARAHVSTPRAAWVEAVRRILAAGGAA